MLGAGNSRVLLGTALQIWAAEVPEPLVGLGDGGFAPGRCLLLLALSILRYSVGKLWEEVDRLQCQEEGTRVVLCFVFFYLRVWGSRQGFLLAFTSKGAGTGMEKDLKEGFGYTGFDMEMRWKEARQRIELGAFVCLGLQLGVGVQGTHWDRRISFSSQYR